MNACAPGRTFSGRTSCPCNGILWPQSGQCPLLARGAVCAMQVAAEALQTMQAMVPVLRPQPPSPVPTQLEVRSGARSLTCAGPLVMPYPARAQGKGLLPCLPLAAHAAPGLAAAVGVTDAWPFVQPLVNAVLGALAERLSASQQDQEVKEAAIACTGAAVACLGDTSPKQTTKLLEVQPVLLCTAGASNQSGVPLLRQVPCSAAPGLTAAQLCCAPGWHRPHAHSDPCQCNSCSAAAAASGTEACCSS